MAKHFYCGNTLPLLIKVEKLIQIFEQLRPIQRWEVCDKSKNGLAVIKYPQKKSMAHKEIHENVVQIFTVDSPSYATVKKWAAEFKRCRDNTEDDPGSGHSKTSTSDEQADAIHCIPWDDRRLTVQQITKSICFSSSSLVGCLGFMAYQSL